MTHEPTEPTRTIGPGASQPRPPADQLDFVPERAGLGAHDIKRPEGNGMTRSGQRLDTVVLDVDGTLVDSVYAHVRTWYDAFVAHGVQVPAWRIHRAIGMGGDRLVTEVAGSAAEAEHGDALRSEQAKALAALTEHIRPLPGAAALVTSLQELGLSVVIASSGNREQTERMLAIVDADREPDAVAAGGDAEASKPDSRVVDVAVENVGGRRAVVIGDATWDMRAARDGGHRGWAVLTGGISEAELRDAGADQVFPGAPELVEHLRSVAAGPR